MMRCYLLCLLTVGVWTTAALADNTPTGIYWPGWSVETSEQVDGPGYPITYMLDGSPASAWVFHHYPDGPDKAKQPIPRHGVGAWVSISKMIRYGNPQSAFTIDGIGIINGYAKNREVYLRNNRIRTVRVTLATSAGGKRKTWSKEFSLRETRELQRLPLARQSVYHIRIEVLKVDVGPDDDLCISELALYDRGKRLSWQLPKAVLFCRNATSRISGRERSARAAEWSGKITISTRLPAPSTSSPGFANN